MPNQQIRAAAAHLPETIKYKVRYPNSIAALADLWHKSEGVVSRGNYPDHLMNLIIESKEKLMRKIVGAPCSTAKILPQN